MFSLEATGAFKIDQPPETYIYDIVPISEGLAVISSDNSLRLINPLSLHGAALNTIENVHTDITCLETLDEQNSIVCTAGRDGRVIIFDFRSKNKVAEVKTGRAISLNVLCKGGCH
jgi:WD40 repeat protein